MTSLVIEKLDLHGTLKKKYWNSKFLALKGNLL